jgi:hypothetical protein
MVMPLRSVVDIVYPSGAAGEINPLGMVYASLNEAQKDQFINHQKFVFLSQTNREEIQRCASLKVPVILQLYDLKSSFDVFKMSAVKIIFVALRGNTPIIDFGWMGKAFEEKKSVVFSLPELQRAFSQRDALTLQEYRKIAQLLVKSKIPLGLASFSQHENERLSEEDIVAWAGYLGVSSLSVQWFL